MAGVGTIYADPMQRCDVTDLGVQECAHCRAVTTSAPEPAPRKRSKSPSVAPLSSGNPAKQNGERTRPRSRPRPAMPVPPGALEVYTDGACSGNPGPGGWAWVVDDGRQAAGSEAM